jgi:segregation and condensation protein B
LARPRKAKPRVDASAAVVPEPVVEAAPEPVRQRPFARLPSPRRRYPSPTVPVLSPPATTEQPETNMEIQRIVEAILFAAKQPMTAKQVQQTFPELEQPDVQDIQAAIDAIIEDYRLRPIELKRVASGYRFQVRAELSYWVARLFEEKPPKYSRALMETLAIIAYRQPVTRGDIEDIRGVSVSSSMMQTLLEREWIRIIAHKEAPGRPALYSTTRQFLDYFNLSGLNELPALQSLQGLDLSTYDPPTNTGNP